MKQYLFAFGVSIRALTRRATKESDGDTIIITVSIRALTRRATVSPGMVSPLFYGFNSCPHAEGNSSFSRRSFSVTVSIRALTRRATNRPIPVYGNVQVSIRALTRRATAATNHGSPPLTFQFVPSRGGQPSMARTTVLNQKFQFVPSRGGQLAQCAFTHNSYMFQFVPSRGGQPVTDKIYVHNDYVSIRALTRRATQADTIYIVSALFQFVPSRGGQPKPTFSHSGISLFQFVPSRGGQRNGRETCLQRILFQFVPSRGGQPGLTGAHVGIQGFQFVPSRGGQPAACLFIDRIKHCFNSCPHAEGNFPFLQA